MHSRVSWSVLYNYMMPILSSFFPCSYKCMKILVWALPIIDEKSYLFPWRSARPVGAVKCLMGDKLQCESWDTRFECPELQSLLALTLEYKRAEPGHCWAEITQELPFFSTTGKLLSYGGAWAKHFKYVFSAKGHNLKVICETSQSIFPSGTDICTLRNLIWFNFGAGMVSWF